MRLLEDSTRLGVAVETAFFKHVYSRTYQSTIGFSFWRDRRGHEVDVIAEAGGKLVPFEVKYRSGNTRAGDLKGLQILCEERGIPVGYAITREMDDFSRLPAPSGSFIIVKIPAPLACYWLSLSELVGADPL